ncbi:glycine betaine ABC transporter substrate-binding protein [Rhodococcus sp. MEB064]|uniref:glycine betaine ABC transporter substrate-binding protein n=1 Tax=Rhodococcus sp. MEB064 TaxID=1587522 RepID=UPI000696883B|nr:glycine betaine ABC transporter substrate-binding protein [Rhodococcus sp. MEB064]
MRGSKIAAVLLPLVLSAGCSSAAVDEPTTTVGALAVADTGTPVQSVLAHIYAGALTRDGMAASVMPVDDTAAALTGLDDASVSMLPGFTGSLLRQLDPSSDARDADDVYGALARALPEWLSVSDQGLAENGPTVSVPSTVGSTLEEATVSALAPQCETLSADVEPAADDAAVRAVLDEVYDCLLAAPGGVPAVTVLDATDRSSDPESTDVVLADDRDGFVAEEVVPLFRKGSVDDESARRLQVIAGELTTADLARMVERVRAGEDPSAIARNWLGEQSF